MYIAIKVVIKNGNCKRPWHINPLRLKDFPLFLLEPRRIHSFPLLFLITAELVCERYAQLAETRVMVGYILRLEADARRDLPGFEYIVAIQIQDAECNQPLLLFPRVGRIVHIQVRRL